MLRCLQKPGRCDRARSRRKLQDVEHLLAEHVGVDFLLRVGIGFAGKPEQLSGVFKIGGKRSQIGDNVAGVVRRPEVDHAFFDPSDHGMFVPQAARFEDMDVNPRISRVYLPRHPNFLRRLCFARLRSLGMDIRDSNASNKDSGSNRCANDKDSGNDGRANHSVASHEIPPNSIKPLP